MDLQRRISRLLAWLGMALLASSLLVPAFGGDAVAAPDGGRTGDQDDKVTTTTAESTSTTGKKRRRSTTTTAQPVSSTTSSTVPATTTSAPGTSSTSTSTSPTSTSASSTSTTTATAPATTTSTSGSGSTSGRETSAAQVAPTTTSTLHDHISRGPKSPSPIDPPSPAGPPPAPVTSSTVRRPAPPATVSNPLPNTPVTSGSGLRPNPLRLEGTEETPGTAGPPVPEEIQAGAPEAEGPRGAQGAAAPAAAPPGRAPAQLGATGSGTRTLLFLAGIALLLGALAVAFGEPGGLRTTGAERNRPTRARRRARTLRRTLPGWESGVPHAPLRRAAKRTRLQRQGLLGASPPDDGPAA